MTKWGLILALCGCTSGDPCDDFPNDGCIDLQVRGEVSIDQVRVRSTALQIDGVSPMPPPAAPFRLPVQLAIVPGPITGDFTLDVDGLLLGSVLASGQTGGALAPGQHTSATVILTAGSVGGVDLGGVDFSGVDFSGVDLRAPDDLASVKIDLAGVKIDLAGVDLATSTLPDLSAIPVGGPCQQKSDCDPGQVCALIAAPLGVCTRPCSNDSQCDDLSQGGIPSICMTSAAPAGCSQPCNPVAGPGADGCTGGYVCSAQLTGPVTYAECTPSPGNTGTRISGQSCNGSFPCEEGLTCNGGFCAGICRISVPADCAGACTGTGALGVCG